MRATKRQLANIWALSLVPMTLQATALKTDLEDIQTALGVPALIAKVTDGVLPYGGGVPDVILVQDIHRHPEVQGHIAAFSHVSEDVQVITKIIQVMHGGVRFAPSVKLEESE